MPNFRLYGGFLSALVLYGLVVWVLRAYKNPKCPRCKIRDSMPEEVRSEAFDRDKEGNLKHPLVVTRNLVVRGRRCNGCHIFFEVGVLSFLRRLMLGYPKTAS